MKISEALLPINRFSRSGRRRPATKAVVLHWVANPGSSARANRDYFASLAAQAEDANNRYASAHYIVGLRGEIIRCVPEEEVAYHCGSSAPDPASGKVYTDWARRELGEEFAARGSSPNYATIGIELCHPTREGFFTTETLEAAAALAADLCRRYSLEPARALARHYDVVGWKDCPRYWVKNPEAWEAFKLRVAELVKEG